MLLSKSVNIYICNSNITRYKKLGYNAVLGEYLTVDIKDAPLKSSVIVEVECDYCHSIYYPKYSDYNRHKNEIVKKDCCKKCIYNKTSETVMIKYNVDNVAKLEDITQKKKETIKDKYGVDNIYDIPGVKEKIINTFFSRYGYDNPLKNPEVKQKLIETIKNRTDEERLNIIKKRNNTLIKNDDTLNFVKTSKQQIYLCNLFNCEINVPIDYYIIDGYFSKYKIDFEYDGGFHNGCVKLSNMTEEDFQNKENMRNGYMYSKGIKVFRIKSADDKLPPDEELIKIKNNALYYLIEKDKRLYIYNLNTKEIYME